MEETTLISETKDDTDSNDSEVEEHVLKINDESHENGKRKSAIEVRIDEAMKPPSLLNLNSDWLKELDESLDKEPFLLSKPGFVTQCNETAKCLNYLLSNELTTVYASVSQLFKTFRSVFSSNQKMKNKTFELMAQAQAVNKLNAQLKKEIEEKDETMKRLEDHLEEDKKQKELAEKSKSELKSKLDEQQKKYAKLEEGTKMKLQDNANSADEIDSLKLQLDATKSKLKSLEEKSQQFEQTEKDSQHEIKMLKQKLEHISMERHRIQASVRAQKEELQQKLNFINSLQEQIENLKLDLEASKNESENLTKEVKYFQARFQEATHDCALFKKNISARQFHVSVLKAKNDKLEQINREKQIEISKLEIKLNKMTISKNDMARKVEILDQKVRELQTLIDEQKGQTLIQQHEMEIIMKTESNKDKEIRQLKEDLRKNKFEFNCLVENSKNFVVRFRAQENFCWELKKSLEFSRNKASEYQNKIKSLEEKVSKLSFQVLELSRSKSQLENQVYSLEKSNANKHEEIFKLKKELHQEKEDSRFSRNAEYDTKKQLEITKIKLKEVLHFQQAFSESTQQQISRIRNLENQILKLQKQVSQLHVQNQNIRCTLKQLQSRNKELSNDLESKERDYRNTSKTLDEKERELEISKRKFNALAAEKSAIDTKLTEKTKELAMKIENVELLAQEISQIKTDVTQKETEIRFFKTEIRELRRVQAITKKQLQENEYLKNEIAQLNKLLESERLKSKSTEEEIQKPNNMHRWRMLSGTEIPEKYLMLKCVHLQKLLTKKSDLLTKKENELANKEKMIEDLLADKKKREDSNIEKKLWSCQKELSDCKREIKCLLGEKLVYESVSGKYESQIKNLSEELKKIKLSKK
ncbi:uncharacterized protein TNCT_383571 [Trichonephila clavata]|uniref:Uncharacterized protein n=1 Tax=Trichonephila clavata TaxID=2740835 RepID=A0A8X6H359_TRICU|nr:uncharacterized protein TNCT_383571 [Trichonephila clavata]